MLTHFTRVSYSGWTGLVFAAFIVLVVPMFAGSLWLSVLTSTACFALAIAGVSFLYARLGMVSLAQVGLMGLGGWVMLRFYFAFGLPFEVNLIIAGLITMLCGMLLALPALRMRGLFLALVTLMAAGGLEIVLATYQFPNGGEGFWGVQTGIEKMPRPGIAQSDSAYMRYVMIVATLGFVLIEMFRRMSTGRAWALIRRSEAAAMAAGVNVTAYKTIAFGLSGLLAGLAGGLLAGSLGLLDGGTFRASESILLFALAVVGGARYWLGVVIAAALFRILPALLNNWGVDADLSYVIFGAGLLHAVITAPNGIAGQIIEAVSGRFARNAGAQATANPPNIDGAETQTSQDTQVEINDVTVRFGGVVALDTISASFTAPVTGIIGPNGAGKTTLMNVFSGLLTPANGSVAVGATQLSQMAPHMRSRVGLRRSFQKEEIAEDLTVSENILVQIDQTDNSFADRQSEVMRVLDIVGMAHKADTLGGDLNKFERRLTDFAKCIVGTPKLIMFDEPAGGLSQQETRVLGDLILSVHRLTGAQTLVIDHDVELITRICNETLVLDFGKRIAFGPTNDVLEDPKVKAAYLGVEEVAA
ncbi:ATP-binding cassette domain-containing protein [uncultured Tateyamaria sp.]|uniref:branched-chain amino acid ABC transporter ATP-binding protein/permease n=1 Tax=uncultured Tateyamaria sp. TaxID=455651 RepID=UPI002609AD06|nr:ATP-binding cassette domain-containing protein [uncultured Tateyamaria sp.]